MIPMTRFPETPAKCLGVILMFTLQAISTPVALAQAQQAQTQTPASEAQARSGAAPRGTRPALVVNTVQPERVDLGDTLVANGSIAAWQEAVVGAELAGVRLIRLQADIGQQVASGQVLAVLDDAQIRQDLAAAQAVLAEANAALAEARIQAIEAQANAGRARKVEGTGAFSEQQLAQFKLADQAAQARVALGEAKLQSARAQLELQQLRLRNTEVRAPDDGVILSRQAVLGAVVSPGQELFRMIRGGRLEWRAEVIAAELARIRPGQKVLVHPDGAAPVTGMVRRVSPSIDANSRNALVHVDLPASSLLRAGQFARGDFLVGTRRALTVPQIAVVMRDGFAYVFRVQGDRVAQVKVRIGRRSGDRIEILDGVKPDDRLVGQGAAFLNDADLVQVQAPSK
jgi:RND family efflux transporter MFP subunit